MGNKYTNPLMDKLNAVMSGKGKAGGFRNVLKTSPENTYLVRFIPNEEDMSKTFFEYYTHGWTSNATGRYVSTVCPSTYGEDCPICNERFRLWNKGDEASKELSKMIARKERFYSNVYVVEDPTNSENNGTVKILGFGRQIKKIIDEAREGDDADEIGGRMIDFTAEGCNLRIKVEKNSGGYPNYDRSKFVNPSNVPVSLEDVVAQIHDFDPLLVRKTNDEMQEMLDEALYGTDERRPDSNAPSAPPSAQKVSSPKDETVDDSDIPMEFETGNDDILDELNNL